jgi:putative oxidoreductase
MTRWAADLWAPPIDPKTNVNLKEGARSPMDITMTGADAAGRTRLRDAALFLARLGLASLFLFSGIQKLTSQRGAAEWAASQGVPLAHQLMPLVALFEIGAALMLITGWRARMAAAALAAWIIVLGPLFHQFWNAPPQLWQASIDNFFHHLVMFGGMTYVAVFGPGGWRLASWKR